KTTKARRRRKLEWKRALKRPWRMLITSGKPGDTRPMRTLALPAAVFGLFVLSTPASAEITKAPAQKTKQAIKVETFAKGLVHPWGMAFLPNGRLLVTERP